MKIINQSWDWIQKPQIPLPIIEQIGRTCYQSQDKMTEDSAKKFVSMIMKSGHESVIEHVSASVKFITNRGVTHELVRHRLASFSQESTRYVKYDGEMEFIRPVWWVNKDNEAQDQWIAAMYDAEDHYLRLVHDYGWRPEQAREVLPNSLKTEIVVTANLREWIHIFKLRCSPKAHPQIRTLMRSCLFGFHESIPIIFDDLYDLYVEDR